MKAEPKMEVPIDTCARCAELNAEIERLRAALARETAWGDNLQSSLVKFNGVRIETELRAERAEAALAECQRRLAETITP